MTKSEQRELVALLWQMRAFVYRAAEGGKKPHAQDKLDAQACLPRLNATLARHPEPTKHVATDGGRVVYSS